MHRNPVKRGLLSAPAFPDLCDSDCLAGRGLPVEIVTNGKGTTSSRVVQSPTHNSALAAGTQSVLAGALLRLQGMDDEESTFNDLCVRHFALRVPHPCVFCKGGRRCCRRNFCPFSTNPFTYAFIVLALRQQREGRGPHRVGDAREIKSLGHPPSEYSSGVPGLILLHFKNRWNN